jgi:hypothetical protein
VPPEALRRVWQDTTQVEYEWDRPIYEEFFRTVRTVNASLPRSRQLRDSLAIRRSIGTKYTPLPIYTRAWAIAMRMPSR